MFTVGVFQLAVPTPNYSFFCGGRPDQGSGWAKSLKSFTGQTIGMVWFGWHKDLVTWCICICIGCICICVWQTAQQRYVVWSCVRSTKWGEVGAYQQRTADPQLSQVLHRRAAKYKSTHKHKYKYTHKYKHKYRNKYSYTNVCKYKCGYKRCTDEALELKPLPELTLGIQHCTNSIRRTPSQFILESTVFSSTHTNSAKNSPVGVSGTK